MTMGLKKLKACFYCVCRISSMVEKLCTHYGEEICIHDGTTYYAFPEVEKLSKPEVGCK